MEKSLSQLGHGERMSLVLSVKSLREEGMKHRRERVFPLKITFMAVRSKCEIPNFPITALNNLLQTRKNMLLFIPGEQAGGRA